MKDKIKQFFQPIKCDHEWSGSKETLDKIIQLRDKGDKKIIRLLQTFNRHEITQCEKCGKWEGFKWL